MPILYGILEDDRVLDSLEPICPSTIKPWHVRRSYLNACIHSVTCHSSRFLGRLDLIRIWTVFYFSSSISDARRISGDSCIGCMS